MSQNGFVRDATVYRYAPLPSPMATREILYVLQLEDGKYYVGKTKDLKRRVEEHAKGDGSEWTWMYRPVKVLESRPLKDEHDENNTTKDMMKKYGVENVRGGSYCQMELPKGYEAALQAEIRGAEDACFKCGGKGHFARDCPVDGDVETRKSPKQIVCYRCGRPGHLSPDCYTYTSADGKYLGPPPRSPYEDSSSEEEEDDDVCERCGRDSHSSDECYATTHFRGGPLRRGGQRGRYRGGR